MSGADAAINISIVITELFELSVEGLHVVSEAVGCEPRPPQLWCFGGCGKRIGRWRGFSHSGACAGASLAESTAGEALALLCQSLES